MELKVFDTLVKEGHKLYNDYVRGRITGIAYMICDERKDACRPCMIIDGIGYVFTLRCTQEQYDRLTKVIEDMYPDLCEFNWKV